MQGWIKLYRKLSDNPLWTCEPFSKGQAWVDLILIANHERGFIYVRGNKITVERGQVGWSEKKLASRWRWSRTKVRKFLKDLESEHQIKQQKNSITSLITITNYEEHQSKEQQTGQQKDSRKTAERQQKDTNKNDKKNKNEKNNNKFTFDSIEFPNQLKKINGFVDAYREWYEHRKEIKKPLTEIAVKKQLNKLIKLQSEGNNPIEVINQSIENSYQGFFPVKRTFKQKKVESPYEYM